MYTHVHTNVQTCTPYSMNSITLRVSRRPLLQQQWHRRWRWRRQKRQRQSRERETGRQTASQTHTETRNRNRGQGQRDRETKRDREDRQADRLPARRTGKQAAGRRTDKRTVEQTEMKNIKATRQVQMSQDMKCACSRNLMISTVWG